MMRTIQGWANRLRGMFGKNAADRALNEEIESHIAMAVADRVRSGMIEGEARREVLMQFHGVEASKQRYREQRGVPALEHFFQDIRYALRAFRKDKSFAVTAIGVLVLGFIAAIAIFSLVDAALIQPLPYRDPNRLMFVTGSVKEIRLANLSYLDYLDIKKENKVFSSLDVHRGAGYLLANGQGMELVRGAEASAGFFRTLGVRPILGRDFYDGEDAPEAEKVALLSYGTWKNRFAGRKDVVGQTVQLDGVERTIIGVLPPSFDFAGRPGAEFWTPLQRLSTEPCLNRRSCHNLYGVARLKDGETAASAQADLNVITARLEAQYPESNKGQTGLVIPLAESEIGKLRPILLVMLAGAVLLLLIACVNVASLLLVRSEGRKREMAVRVALGASPRRLLRQFVAEGVVLAGISTAVAVFGAKWAMAAMIGLVPENIARAMPFLRRIGFTSHVMFVTALLFIAAVAVFSAVPLVRVRLNEMQEGLKQDGHSSAGKTWRRFAGNLVVAELAITLMLLVAAGLLGQSLYRLQHVDLGFEPDHLVTIGNVVLPDRDYPKEEQVMAARKEIVDSIERLPGVRSAALTSQMPIQGNGNTTWIRVIGHEWHGEHNETNERKVNAQFFTTIQARLLKGRYFTEAEDLKRAQVVVVNQAFVDKYLRGEDPIGKKIVQVGGKQEVVQEIIGVVDNIREGSLDDETWATIYGPDADSMPSLLVRTEIAPESMIPAITAALRKINPNIATSDYRSMTERINDSQSAYVHRSSAALVGGFAATALLLSVVGLYGVIAYSVGQRTREIGIRMALGARRENIYRLVLTEAGWLVIFGVVAGIVGAALTSKMMRSLLFGVGSWDLHTFAGVVLLLGLAAMFASFFPARRAASVDPMNVLRAE